MEYRLLGRTGVKISPLCLGTLNFGNPTPEKESIEIIDLAIDRGINFIDTANSYNDGESEAIVGHALKTNGRRDQVILATKVYGKMGEGPNEGDASYHHILRACEDSLRRLQTDHIDLYHLHRPSRIAAPEEALRAFDQLVREGKVRYAGCSTHPAWQVMEAICLSERNGWIRYVCEQPPYNLLDRRIENELIPLCQKYGMSINPWGPLAMGILGGVYPLDGSIPPGSRVDRMGGVLGSRLTRKALEVGAAVGEMAMQRGLSPGQLALLWVKDQPGITSPIIGPETTEQLRDLLPVLEMNLDEADRPRFDELVHPGNAVSDFHHTNDWMKARIVD